VRSAAAACRAGSSGRCPGVVSLRIARRRRSCRAQFGAECIAGAVRRDRFCRSPRHCTHELRSRATLLETRPHMPVSPGHPYPRGATWTGTGVNFAIFSAHASKVELCLFDSPDATKESARIALPEQTDQVWHGFLPDARPNQLYGYRVHGPYEPSEGHRFNPHKVVMDPYATSVARTIRWSDEMFGYEVGHADVDLSFDARDNAAFAPLAAVVDPAFTWGDDHAPRTAWHNTVIYEMHVRGFTKRHPAIPEHLRGTYEALTTEPAIEHLKTLGVT